MNDTSHEQRVESAEDVDLSDRSTVLEVLEYAPGLIARKAKLAVEADRQKRYAQRAVKAARAVAFIRYKDKGRNKETTEAHVEQDEAVIAAENHLIETIAAEKIAQIEVDRIYNLYISARKVGGMSDTEMKVLHGSIAGVSRDDKGNRVDMRTGEILG